MRPDTTLTLGDFEFADFEIPEKIPFGGEQRMVVHELVGGLRVIQAMGATPKTLDWSGVFIGKTATERAFELDAIRKSGKQRLLTWAGMRYGVIVKSLSCDYLNFHHIPYQIQCEVVQDMTDLDSIKGYIADINQLIAEDMNTAAGIAGKQGDGVLSSLMGGLDTAIKNVSDFAKATTSTINSVLQPIADVRARVGILFTQVNAVTRNVTTLGGILPNNPIAQQANRLMTQVNAHLQAPQLHQLDSVLGRMQANIGTIRK